MKTIILLKYTLFISAITFGCNQIEKKNNSEGTNPEINTETDTSLPQSEPQGMTTEPQGMTTEPHSTTFKTKLWQQGIDFYATGNEPFWSIVINMDTGINFSHMDGTIIETTSLEIHKAVDAKLTRFSGNAEAGDIFVTVTEEECNDTMADQRFRNSVIVEIKKEGGETNTFKGCGDFVPDYRLHDIWVLIEANGQEIEDDMLNDKGSPTFEFYVEEGRLSGYAGCNNLNGSFYRAGKDVLHFDPLAMTRMMCPEMKLEDIITQSVAGKRMKYEIKDLKLALRGYDGTELIFKKVD